MSRSYQALALLFVAACGGASSENAAAKQPEPSAAQSDGGASGPAETPKTAAPASETVDPNVVPTKCGDGQSDGICAPPRPYVKFLCGSFPRPDIALVLFNKSSPWTRAYLNRNVEAWYTSGQQSTSAKLLFDEEVLVLSHPKAGRGGMVVEGAGTPYDVLRLDGVCSSVGSEEITMKHPP